MLDLDCRKHDTVIEAEFLWTLKTMSLHYLYNSCRDVQLFRKIIGDTEIPRSFTCGKKKCAYIACHGLWPFPASQVQDMVEKLEHFIVLFDEEVNEQLQKKHLDIYVWLWNNVEVIAEYFVILRSHQSG